MCLYTADNKFRIAEKDIRCYKILLYYPCYTMDKLRTPYEDFGVSLGKTYKDTVSVNKYGNSNCWTVKGGVFHSYVHKKDALRAKLVFDIMKYAYDEAIVVMSIIPKRTKYYVGESY